MELNASELLKKVSDGKSLSFDEAYFLCNEIMEGKLSPVLISAFLVALKVKGETFEEIAGFAKAMREKAVKVDFEGAVDTCGTGGDGKGTFNISTVSALVLASVGVPVAKHGNRAVSSAVGSADILKMAGIKIELSPEEAKRWLSEYKFAFLFAPLYHPAMKNVMPVRRELGIRTIFNLLGPITNPARVKRQVIGVFSPDFAEKIAKALTFLGTEKAVVVWGAGGIDEFSPEGENIVIEVSDGKTQMKKLKPEDVGGERGYVKELVVDKERAVEKFFEVVEGREKGPIENAVCMNSALALWIAGKVKEPKEGYKIAQRTIREGKVARLVEKLREESPKS